MSHYQITLPIDKDEVQIIKEQFRNYMEQGGEIVIGINIENQTEESIKLTHVIKGLFITLLVTLSDDEFEGLN